MTTHADIHRSLQELEQALPSVLDSPKDAGVLSLIVRRPATDAREVLDEAQFDPAAGLVGDTWPQRPSSRTGNGTPHPDMQITLMNVRVVEAIAPEPSRWPLAGDQLFVDLDLTPDNLPPGTRLQIGSAVLEVTSQPHTGCNKFAARFGGDALKFVNSPGGRALHLRGIYARVVQAGSAARGSVVTVVRPTGR